jgi:tRNA pseudouridine65 synthase
MSSIFCWMLEILYQDEYIAAINKPSGLLVHKSFMPVMQKCTQYRAAQSIGGQHVYPIHRLKKHREFYCSLLTSRS